MSTNGNGRSAPSRQLVKAGGRNAIEETKGARSGNPEDTPIQPGEMAFPIGGDPWAILGFQDPSVMKVHRDIELDDLRRMTQRDGHARAMLNVLTWPMRAAKRVVEPDEDGEEEADFIDAMLNDPPHKGGMTTTMDYILTSHGLAFRDGFKVFEKCTAIRTTREGETGEFREVLRKLKPLPSNTIAFRYDEYGGFDGIVQTIYWKGEKRIVPLPREKCLLFTVGKEESPLEGESLFLPAYYHYDKKHRLYYIAHLAAQAAATGLRVGTMGSADSKLKHAFLDALRSLGVNGSMVVPLGAEVDVHTIPSILGDLIKMIEHHDMAMSKSILAHFLDIGTEGKGQMGTASTTSELGDLFVVALEAHLRNIAEGITAYLIPYFIDRNFGTGRYPTFRFEPFSDEQKEAMADTFGKLFNATSQPVADMMFEVQRNMAEALGLENIDWDSLKADFDKEQLRKKDLEETKDAVAKDLLLNPPPPPVPGEPKAPTPKIPTPPELSEDTNAVMRRAVLLAEAQLSGKQVLDSIGRPVVANDRVMLAEDDESPIFTVQEVVGSTLILKEFEADNPTGPIARSASSVLVL